MGLYEVTVSMSLLSFGMETVLLNFHRRYYVVVKSTTGL